jgi:hypothetical protein
MEKIERPANLSMKGNVAASWKKFKQHFELYLLATGLSDKADARKIALLLTVAGTEAIEVYNTFEYNGENDDSTKYSCILEKFEAYCSPKKNETYERYCFNTRIQQEGEAFDCFLKDLYLKAQTCNYGLLKDSLIRDRIVVGIRSMQVKEELLKAGQSKDGLSLEQACIICKAHESTAQHMKALDSEKAAVLHVKQSRSKRTSQARSKPTSTGKKDADRKSRKNKTCGRCDTVHDYKNCPAWGHTCKKCSRKNHYEKMCRMKKVHEIELESSSQDDYEYDTDEDYEIDEVVFKIAESVKVVNENEMVVNENEKVVNENEKVVNEYEKVENANNVTKSVKVVNGNEKVAKQNVNVVKQKVKVYKSVQNEKNESVSSVKNEKSVGVQNVKNEKSESVQKEKNESVSSVKNEKSVGVQNVKNEKSESVQNVKNEKSESVQNVKNGKSESVQNVKNEKSVGVQNEKTKCVQNVKNEKSESVQKEKSENAQSVKNENSNDLTNVENVNNENVKNENEMKQNLKNENSDDVKNVNIECENILCIDKGKGAREWIAPVTIHGTIIPMKVDTGAQANLMTEADYRRLKNRPSIKKKAVKLVTYNQDNIDVIGTCRVQVRSGNKSTQAQFIIVPGEDRPSLLGLKTCERLDLVQKAKRRVRSVYSVNKQVTDKTAKLIETNKDVFEGLGCLPGEYKIKLQEGATPVIHAARKVPLALKDRLKKELNRLCKLGVIEKTKEPTEWVQSLVVVEKPNGDLRLCIDPKDLNKVILREHRHLPHKSEIQAEMAGAKYFTKLDAAQGFYNIKLDAESSKLCTVNTPFGRYSFKRLPFGVNCAPEVFQHKMEQLLEDIQGVRVFVDDIVIWGNSEMEHDDRLEEVLGKIKQAGLKLNKKKCQFKQQEIVYLGEKIGVKGVEPDTEKVKAIINMPDPKSQKDVQRMLGLVNYLTKFMPNLSVQTSHMRTLLRDDVEWTWQEEHQKEWDSIKASLQKEPVLQFFDTALPIKLSSDASKDGLGAALLQCRNGYWHPVAYASRSMTNAEKNYAQIEKELLGIVFATQKFHEFVYGVSVIMETDHKPLIAMKEKPICDLGPRLQRLMLKLRKYDLNFQYTPGRKLVLADALSRAYQKNTENTDNDLEEEINLHVHYVRTCIPISSEMWCKIAEATEKDETLSQVKRCILTGWSNRRNKPAPYRDFTEDLTIVEGVILKRQRAVIPPSMRKDMLDRIHEGHLGSGKCKHRARRAVYWPNMNKEIETLVGNCTACLTFQKKQQKEPLQQQAKPHKPWHTVGADLFALRGKNYLLVIDYDSNFPEVEELEQVDATCVILNMRKIFSRQGIPQVVYTDNGPQFDCQEFREFSQLYEFRHKTSSPNYPRSNGKAEGGVRIVKNIFKKALLSGDDPYLGLLAYRASPLEETGESPGEMLQKRRLRTRLPEVEHRGTTEARINEKQKLYHDKNVKVLPTLERKDTVRLHDGTGWRTLARVEKLVAPNSYLVQTETGKLLRRNRKDLLKTSEEEVIPRVSSTARTCKALPMMYRKEQVQQSNQVDKDLTIREHTNVCEKSTKSSESRSMPGVSSNNCTPSKSSDTVGNKSYVTKRGRVVIKPKRFVES